MSRRDWRSLRGFCDVGMPDSLARLLARHNITPAEYRDLEHWCGAGEYAAIADTVKRAVRYDHELAERDVSR